MNNVTVDAKSVLRMFAELNSRQQKNAHRQALKKATSILVGETKRNFRKVVRKPNSKNRWNGKSFISGIKLSINKSVSEGKVHIMGDFRLKFFELGTKNRIKRKTKSSTGNITGKYFFAKAKQSKQGEIESQMNNIISQSIKKVYERNKNR